VVRSHPQGLNPILLDLASETHGCSLPAGGTRSTSGRTLAARSWLARLTCPPPSGAPRLSSRVRSRRRCRTTRASRKNIATSSYGSRRSSTWIRPRGSTICGRVSLTPARRSRLDLLEGSLGWESSHLAAARTIQKRRGILSGRPADMIFSGITVLTRVSRLDYHLRVAKGQSSGGLCRELDGTGVT
jgi:hypothetical protein